LGLSTVYGILKQSGGSINVYSEPGRGTTFKFYLPASGDASAVYAGDRKNESATDPSGGGTILIVEDEESVRKLVERTLSDAGYNCLSAVDAESALDIARGFSGTLDLLLTDVILPGMNGKLLAEKLMLQRPGIKVLFMSGYTDNAIVHHGVLDAGTEFLNKPFSAQTLRNRVQEVLAQKSA
jgi:two-component system cell cycle sensor histidine kinase/response regulator CckA